MSKLGLRLHADEEHWIPLSDLMTGLMFLFLLIAISYMVAVNAQSAHPRKVLSTYVSMRAQIDGELRVQLGGDLAKWHGSIDPTTLTVRFPGIKGRFAPGSAQLEPQFQQILTDFFPKYLRILSETKYRKIVSEIRIEGYTSTLWNPGANPDQSYLGNMALSQDRARAVLQYVVGLPAATAQTAWLRQELSADGFSSSHVQRRPDGSEDADASQRVEFRVLTDPDAQIRAALQMPKTQPSNGQSTAPVAPPPPEINAPLPAFPAFARAIVGKRLASVFPKTSTECLGYLDGVVAEYAGRPSGAEVFGWAYDLRSHAALGRILLADSRGRIIGAAVGGFPRPDVPAHLTILTSLYTGWQGYAAFASGPVTAWAATNAPQTVCRLGLNSIAVGQRM